MKDLNYVSYCIIILVLVVYFRSYLVVVLFLLVFFFFFQAEDGIRDKLVTGVQTCALPISAAALPAAAGCAAHPARSTSTSWGAIVTNPDRRDRGEGAIGTDVGRCERCDRG